MINNLENKTGPQEAEPRNKSKLGKYVAGALVAGALAGFGYKACKDIEREVLGGFGYVSTKTLMAPAEVMQDVVAEISPEKTIRSSSQDLNKNYRLEPVE